MTAPRTEHRQALLMLLLANLFWGLSFPLIKAIQYTHQQLLPHSGGWFVTAMTLAPRFLLALAVLLVLCRKQFGGFAAGEWRQGLVLGAASSLGMVFQIDGLMYTSASVSAFLTQFYAIMIPLYVALRFRRSPPPVIWGSCVLVLAGVAILGRFDFRAMSLGRGEWETLLGSVFFMGQILALEDKRYGGNRVMPVTIVMFATEAVAFTVMALATASQPADVLVPWTSAPWLVFTAMLTVFSTLGAFTIMNKWQPKITATEAGLIYCFEPIFGSIMALFLPAIFSVWAAIHYPNETVSWHLLVGGGLITLANILIQLRPPPKTG
jgi:drug/metabolite transporter (DMT)-like permease